MLTVSYNGTDRSHEQSEMNRVIFYAEIVKLAALGFEFYVNGIKFDVDGINRIYFDLKHVEIKKKAMTVDEFHSVRIMFILLDKTFMMHIGNEPWTHTQWLETILPNYKEVIEKYPRGYVLGTTLAIYRGSDFSDDVSIEEITAIGHCLKQFEVRNIHLGAIPGPDQPWGPKRKFTRVEFITMQQEAGLPEE